MNTASAANLSNTEKWQGMDGHHLHPFTNPNDLVQKPPRIIESAQGVYLTDSDGNELLDMMAAPFGSVLASGLIVLRPADLGACYWVIPPMHRYLISR